MIIKVLAEDTPSSDEFRFEHGLSFYIETVSHKILFDIGQTDVFLYNAKKLGVDISAVDTVIISHGHYDHAGSLNLFFDNNDKARIYISKHAFGDFYNANGNYIGLDKQFKNNERIILTDKDIIIDDEIKIVSSSKKNDIYPCNPYGLKAKINGVICNDNFIHEQYAIISDKGKKYLISGCSHRGIINIIEWNKHEDVSTVIGGFHLFKIPTNNDNGVNKIVDLAGHLLKYDLSYYTCHCTGIEQYNILKKFLSNKIDYLAAGQIVDL